MSDDTSAEWVVQDRDFARFGIDQVRWIPPGLTATWSDVFRCARWEDAIVLRDIKYPYHGMQFIKSGEVCTLQIRCQRIHYPTIDKKPAESHAENMQRIAQINDHFKREAELREAQRTIENTRFEVQRAEDQLRYMEAQRRATVERLEQLKLALAQKQTPASQPPADAKAAAIAATKQAIDDFKAKQSRIEQEKSEAARKTAELKRLVKQQREQRKANQLIEARANTPIPVMPPPEPQTKKGIKRSDLLEYGPSGSQIPGSSLLRDYCIKCGQPMRVVDAGKPNVCLDCRPTGQPGTRTSTITSGDIQYHGGRFNKAEW